MYEKLIKLYNERTKQKGNIKYVSFHFYNDESFCFFEIIDCLNDLRIKIEKEENFYRFLELKLNCPPYPQFIYRGMRITASSIGEFTLDVSKCDLSKRVLCVDIEWELKNETETV